MEQVIPKLYVGSDADVLEAKRRGYARLTAAKDGPDGHREILGYKTMGAPKGKDYLFARKGDHAAMNLIDVDDPQFIPEEMILKGIAFAQEMWKEGKTILIHCNAGCGRTGTVAAGLLIHSGKAKTVKGAITTMRKYKPCAVETTGQEDFLEAYLNRVQNKKA